MLTRSWHRIVSQVTVALAAVVISACESRSNEASDRPSKAPDDSTLARLKQAQKEAQRAARVKRPPSGSTATAVPRGSQRVELPGGAVVITPPAPSVAATRPEPGCTMVEAPGGQRVGIPPAPGITARRIARGKFAISYEFAAFDAPCQPTLLRVSVDVNDDPLPPSGTEAAVDGRRGRIIVSVPALVADADVARATAVSPARLTSRSTSVLIR